MAKNTLDANEFFVIRKNRSGEDGFHEEEMRQFIYQQISLIASLDLVTPPVTQVFNNGAFDTINVFDDIAIQTGQIIANTGTDTITVLNDGIYKLSGGLSVGFAGAEELGVSWAINGVPIAGNPVALAGQGANNPVIVSWESIRTLKANDVVTIGATNLNAGALSAEFSAAYHTVRRIG